MIFQCLFLFYIITTQIAISYPSQNKSGLHHCSTPAVKVDSESTKQISEPCPCSEMDTKSRSIHSFLTSDVTVKWHKSPLLFLEAEWWIQVSFCCSNEKMMMPEANEQC